MGFYILLASVISGACLFGALSIVSKLITKKASLSGSSGEVKLISSEIELFDKLVADFISYTQDLVPLSSYTELVRRKESFEENLANERSKLELLEGRLSDIQKKVSIEEANHANLKKGRDEAIDLANAIKERKAQLESENIRLNEELNTSIVQLDVLTNELNLTPEQEIGFAKLKSSLKNSQEQLTSLSQTYKQASSRFSTLHTQYTDLEKEFTKLVEKDLGGTEDEE